MATGCVSRNLNFVGIGSRVPRAVNAGSSHVSMAGALADTDDEGWIEVERKRKGKMVANLGDFMGGNSVALRGRGGRGRGGSRGRVYHELRGGFAGGKNVTSYALNKRGEVGKAKEVGSKFLAALGDKPRTWSDIVGNDLMEDGEIPLPYFPLKEGVTSVFIPRSEAEEGARRWANTVLMYVVADTPFYSQLKGFISRLWRPKKEWELLSRQHGFFLVRFSDAVDCENVLKGGPWMFDNKLIIVRKWRRGMGHEKDLLKSMPIWVLFPNLSVEAWNSASICRVASYVGKPIKIDRATSTYNRMEYAKVLIEIDINSSFPTEVEVDVEDSKPYKQVIEYSWKPPKCETCVCFGHKSIECPFTIREEDKLSRVVVENREETRENSSLPSTAELRENLRGGVESREELRENLVDRIADMQGGGQSSEAAKENGNEMHEGDHTEGSWQGDLIAEINAIEESKKAANREEEADVSHLGGGGLANREGEATDCQLQGKASMLNLEKNGGRFMELLKEQEKNYSTKEKGGLAKNSEKSNENGGLDGGGTSTIREIGTSSKSWGERMEDEMEAMGFTETRNLDEIREDFDIFEPTNDFEMDMNKFVIDNPDYIRRLEEKEQDWRKKDKAKTNKTKNDNKVQAQTPNTRSRVCLRV